MCIPWYLCVFKTQIIPAHQRYIRDIPNIIERDLLEKKDVRLRKGEGWLGDRAK